MWNRTPGRAAGRAAEGAVPLASVAEAVDPGPLALVTTTDHTAGQECLRPLGGEPSGRTVVTMTTGSPGEVRRTAAEVTSRGARYLHAGLQAPPGTIRTGGAPAVFSGSRPAVDRHADTLALLCRPSSGPCRRRPPSSGPSSPAAAGTRDRPRRSEDARAAVRGWSGGHQPPALRAHVPGAQAAAAAPRALDDGDRRAARGDPRRRPVGVLARDGVCPAALLVPAGRVAAPCCRHRPSVLYR